MLNKAIHILLASLMLFASAGITISKHYCGDQVKDLSFFSTAKSCFEFVKPEARQSCGNHYFATGETSVSRPGCCSTETEFQKVNLYKGPLALDLNPVSLTVGFVEKIEYKINSRPFKVFKFRNYKPPLIESDITLLIQSFLC